MNRIQDVLQKYTGLNDIEVVVVLELGLDRLIEIPRYGRRQLLWCIGKNLFTNSFEYAKLKSRQQMEFYLYEVNLGYSYITEDNIEPPIGYNSLLCPGRSTPDPDQDETLPNNLVVPVGRPIQRMAESYHEYDMYKCKDNIPRFVLKIRG